MNILLVQTGFLGDVVLSTPVISALKRRYPDSKLSVVTTPLAAPLVQYHPDVESVITFDKRGVERGLGGLLRFSKKIKARKFSKVFSLHKSWRTAIALWLSGIPERFGFKEAAGTWLYTKTVKRGDLEHDVLRNLAILRSIDQDPTSEGSEMYIEIPEHVDKQARELLEDLPQKVIGIAPGSVWATKRWTPEGFAAVAQHFASQGYGVVLLGSSADAELGEQVQKQVDVELLNLIGKTDLLLSAGVIANLDLLVSNDSAPLHMASATGTPVVAVFCATVPEFGYGPWRVKSEVVGVDGLSCRPCARHGGMKCPTGTHACQKNLLASTVVGASERLMSHTSKEARS